jgi:hypothetical protein
MSTILEPNNPSFPEVYEIKWDDDVIAGPEGIANRQAKQLVERTAFLKNKLIIYIESLINHIDDVSHVSSTEKKTWNEKANAHNHPYAPENLSLADATGSTTLKDTGSDTVFSWIQSFRNNIKAIFANNFVTSARIEARAVTGLKMFTSSTANKFLKVVEANSDPVYTDITATDVPSLPMSKITNLETTLNNKANTHDHPYASSNHVGDDTHVTSTEKAAWNGKANDADVVKLSGNQSIAGTKTFSISPVVPSKSTAAGNNPTVVATESQVALKANLASPAFTGAPTAPTAAAKTNNTQIATTAYADRAGNPVGSYYTQFAGLNNAFVDSERPSDLFGGTWTLQWNTEGMYFQTEGGGSLARTNGIQEDAIRNILGEINLLGAEPSSPSCTGPFRKLPYFWRTNRGTNSSNAEGGFSFDASLVVPVDTRNHPRNRLIRVWKRTG